MGVCTGWKMNYMAYVVSRRQVRDQFSKRVWLLVALQNCSVCVQCTVWSCCIEQCVLYMVLTVNGLLLNEIKSIRKPVVSILF